MLERRKVDIILISCVKSKQIAPCPAGEMYTSALFKKMMAYAQQLAPRKIFILSAKYGLLDPKTIIAPYEQTLNKMKSRERAIWAQDVLNKLKAESDLNKDHFVFLAGARYREGIVPFIKLHSVPMENMPFGKQLQWLEEQIK